MTCDFRQCGILTSVDSDEPVQPPFKLRNSKWCSISSLTVIDYSSEKQRFWSDCAYAEADLRLCWSHIPHCWKSHVAAYMSNHLCNNCLWTSHAHRHPLADCINKLFSLVDTLGRSDNSQSLRVPRRCFFVDHLCYLCIVFCHAFASVYCCLVVTWRESDDLLAPVCDVYCEFVTFLFGILGQVWYLIVSIPDPCCLSYFHHTVKPV